MSANNENNFVQKPADTAVYGKPRMDFTEFRRLQIMQRFIGRTLLNHGLSAPQATGHDQEDPERFDGMS